MSTSSCHATILSRRLLLLLLLFCTTSTKVVMSLQNIVVVGGGVQGTSVAYHLAQATTATSTKIVLLEAVAPASAASGKGGGFMARSWGDGSPTQGLHHLAFDMYESLATQLNCTSYRKLPVLSVSPTGHNGLQAAAKKRDLARLIPSWLNGKQVGRITAMGYGLDTAQITPSEFVTKMLQAVADRVTVVRGTCVGIESSSHPGSERGTRKVTAVQYTTNDDTTMEPQILPADTVLVSAGPWSVAAEDWFPHAQMELPMEGVKSTSIVWKAPPDDDDSVDATALFCGEDQRFGTHLEVYPRPDGTIYICGIGGSDYVPKDALKDGAFRDNDTCQANPTRVEAARNAFTSMASGYEKGELERTAACLRPCPPDALPYMGRIPGYEGAYINAGHNCWGIAWAPACGKAMTELVVDGESKSINLDPFDPARFTPTTKRGGRGRKRQGTSVGEQW